MIIPSALSRRDALRVGALGTGGLAAPSLPPSATARVKPGAASTVFDVTAYGALGDGKTDDTASIQNALNAAGQKPGSAVLFPPAPGGCYRITGVTVPGGVAALRGEAAALYETHGPGVVSLTGSVLGPLNSTTTSLLAIGVSGNGSVVDTNPHGLTVEGLGFLGTVDGTTDLPGFWAATVIDTSDVTFANCRDLYCGSRGTGAGGFVRFQSSGTSPAFSVNGRVLFCSSFGAGIFVLADGLSDTLPGGGSTDGRVVSCQVNRHNQGVVLGPAHAGAGGWSVSQCHFASEIADSHVQYGGAGHPWTLRVEGCYFDVCGGPHVICNGRGLQLSNNYFRGLTTVTEVAVLFDKTLSTIGGDPAALVRGNAFDLNGATAVRAFGRFQGFTAANFPTQGGGEYGGNLVHNHGAAMPKSWVGAFIGSDSKSIAETRTATLELSQGAVLLH